MNSRSRSVLSLMQLLTMVLCLVFMTSRIGFPVLSLLNLTIGIRELLWIFPSTHGGIILEPLR